MFFVENGHPELHWRVSEQGRTFRIEQDLTNCLLLFICVSFFIYLSVFFYFRLSVCMSFVILSNNCFTYNWLICVSLFVSLSFFLSLCLFTVSLSLFLFLSVCLWVTWILEQDSVQSRPWGRSCWQTFPEYCYQE